MKRFALLMAAMLVASVASAQVRSGDNAAGQATPVPSLPEDVATVTYDTGAPADLIRNDVSSGGNLFNTHQGNPLIGGTAYGVSFYVGQTVANTIAFTFFPNPPVNSTYFIVSGIQGAAFNAFTFAPVNVGTTFLAGVSQYLGFVTDSTMGQGFHGGQINWATNQTFNPYPGENAMMRVTGDIVVPVELMHFDVE